MNQRKKYYQKKKSERRCVNCGKQDKRTLSGRTECVECNEKRLRYTAAQSALQREMHRICNGLSSTQRYYRRQEKHECISCGAKLPKEYFYVRCETCRAKQREYYQKKKTAKRGNA